MRLRVLTFLALLAAALCVPAGAQAFPGQRYDMKVLVISADGNEPTFAAWVDALEREGVPYDTKIATAAAPITAATLESGPAASRYQGVIIATGGLVYFDGTSYVSALAQSEWDALYAWENKYGIRQLTAYTFPTPDYGLNYPTASGSMAGEIATLSAAAKAGAWRYLDGTVPYADVWGYRTTPLDPARFETLVSAADGSSLMGIYRPIGTSREELVSTVDANAYMTHFQVMRHGLLSWLTKGTYLGYERNYDVHVDDVFLPDNHWDPVANTTVEEGPNPIRMTAADVTRAINWQNATGQRLPLLFNGAGYEDYIDEPGSDPLATALLANRSRFEWTNHTYSHMELSTATRSQIENEILRNTLWAARKRLDFNPTEVVTGEHSGLHNPNMAAALRNSFISYAGADNSREPNQYRVGTGWLGNPILTVPRHPTGIYYNVGTFAEQLDEYNYIYFDHCVPTAFTTCRTSAATWQDYVDSETNIIMGHVVNNDPRPHYVHQNNLAEDGTFYPIATAVVNRFNSLYSVPLMRQSMTNAGQDLTRRTDWDATLASVRAYVLDGKVYLNSPNRSIDLPVTGTTSGDVYGGQRSGWREIGRNQTVVLTAAP